MVRDTPPSQDVSTHQIWNSYLKEYRRYGPDTKAGQTDGWTDGLTDSAITICLPKFFWGHKKSFWLSHLNECPEILCGLSCDHRWSQTIPMRNSPWEKGILQGITISLGPAILWVVWWPGRSCTLRRGQVLVFIYRHSPTMNLVEEKQRGLIPPGLQSWPLQLIEHSPTLLVLRHLLLVQRAAVLCTFSTCWIWVLQ